MTVFIPPAVVGHDRPLASSAGWEEGVTVEERAQIIADEYCLGWDDEKEAVEHIAGEIRAAVALAVAEEREASALISAQYGNAKQDLADGMNSEYEDARDLWAQACAAQEIADSIRARSAARDEKEGGA